MVGLSGNNTATVNEGINGAGNVSVNDVIVNTEPAGAPAWVAGGYDIIAGPSIGTLTAVQDTSFGAGSVTWTFVIDSDDPALDGLDDGETLDVTFTIRVTDVSFNGVDYTTAGGTPVAETFEVTITINGRNEVCFTRGTDIMTPSGPRPIEELCIGDLVNTRDNGPKKIKWIAAAKVAKEYRRGNDNLEPIKIGKGALSPGVPSKDLKVSPQHRILLSGAMCELLFAESQILVSAKSLLNNTTIRSCGEDFKDLEYWHMMFDDHEIVFANGCPSESFYFGNFAESTLNDDQIAELLTLFPKLNDARPTLAHPQINKREAAVLMAANIG